MHHTHFTIYQLCITYNVYFSDFIILYMLIHLQLSLSENWINFYIAIFFSCMTRMRTSRSFQKLEEIIISEVIAYASVWGVRTTLVPSRIVSIFQLFPSDCITLYLMLAISKEYISNNGIISLVWHECVRVGVFGN